MPSEKQGSRAIPEDVALTGAGVGALAKGSLLAMHAVMAARQVAKKRAELERCIMLYFHPVPLPWASIHISWQAWKPCGLSPDTRKLQEIRNHAGSPGRGTLHARPPASLCS